MTAVVQVPPELALDEDTEMGTVSATPSQVSQAFAQLSGHSIATRMTHYVAADQQSCVANAITQAAISELVGTQAVFAAPQPRSATDGKETNEVGQDEQDDNQASQPSDQMQVDHVAVIRAANRAPASTSLNQLLGYVKVKGRCELSLLIC